MTNKERIYEFLKDASEGKYPEFIDGWVPSDVLQSYDVGGVAAQRRIRELKENGVLIDMRPVPNSVQREYRLVGSVDELSGKKRCAHCKQEAVLRVKDGFTGMVFDLCKHHGWIAKNRTGYEVVT